MAELKLLSTNFWVDKHIAHWVTMIMIMVNIGLGTAILVGGVVRLGSPSHEPLVAYVNGDVWIWGLWIAAAALLMSSPMRWPNIIGLWLSLAWYTIWMSCFTIAVVHYPQADATNIPVYGGLAMISAAMLTARVIDKSGG